MWNWLQSKRRRPSGSARGVGSRIRGLETLESRSLCAAQPCDHSVIPAELLESTSANLLNSASSSSLVAAVSDDVYEPNDSFSSAANLGTLASSVTVAKLAMQDRSDWFRFTLPARGGSSDRLAINFNGAMGDLDLALYNARGQRVRLSDGVGNSEQVSLNGLAAGTYTVAIYGYGGDTNPSYSLSLNRGVTSSGTTTPTGTTSSGTTSTGTTSTGTTSTGTSSSGTSSTTSSSGSSGSTATTSSSSGFNIEFAFSGLTAAQRAVFEQAAQKWESIIVGDLPNASFGGRVIDDLLITATASSIDGTGGVLAQAGPDRFRSGSYLPYHGVMQFDTADLAAMQADGTLVSVITHEMGHVLGIGTIWEQKGLMVGAGTSSPRFVGSRATAEYNSLFGVSSNGVPLETSGGAGTRDAHWKDSLFGNELMTGYVGPGASMPLSRVTVASLADLGYTVNYAMADPYTPPGRSTTTRALSSSSSSASSSSAAIASGTAASVAQSASAATSATFARPTTVSRTSLIDRAFAGEWFRWS